MNQAFIPLNHGADHQTPNRIVVHAMAEYIHTEPMDYHAVDFLRRMALSVHAFITPSGVVIRSRKDTQGAHHARGFNKDSLGVEFLVPGVHTQATFLEAIKKEYLTPAQYASGVALVKGWVKNHGIERIDRHSELSPLRKQDPGEGFPWRRFLDDVNG